MTILECIVILPLLGALLIALGAPGQLIGLLTAGGNLVLGMTAAWLFCASDGMRTFASSHPVLESPQLSLSFGLDGLSVTMLVLTVIVTFCALLLQRDRSPGSETSRLYVIAPLLISAGALGAFLSRDLFFFYAFHEIALIPTFLAIGILGHTGDRVDTAWRITIYLGVGSLVLLAGLILLVLGLGGSTFDIATLVELAQTQPLGGEAQKWIFLLLLIGFGVLISLFPFHSWAPPAYAAAPTPVAMLHAGVLKKFGLYGLIKIALPMLPAGLEAWSGLILVLLVGNIIVIGLITISQDRLDRMLGYSSVMHMGYVFLGIVSFNQIGLSGAALLMFAHGISIALLFALCGHLRNSIPALNLHAIGGLGKTAPWLCLSFAVAAFASIGLPGFANFAAEVMVFFGGFKGYQGGALGPVAVTTIVALWGVVISAVYMLRAFRRIFQGEVVQAHVVPDLNLRSAVPVWLLIAVLVAVGVYPSLLVDLFSGSFGFVTR